MKVIENNYTGKLKVTCSNIICNSVFEIDQEDFKKIVLELGYSATGYDVTCPCCGEVVYINPPNLWRRNLIDYIKTTFQPRR